MKSKFRSRGNGNGRSAYVSKDCPHWVKFGHNPLLDEVASITPTHIEIMGRLYPLVYVNRNVFRHGKMETVRTKFIGGTQGEKRARIFLLQLGYLPYE